MSVPLVVQFIALAIAVAAVIINLVTRQDWRWVMQLCATSYAVVLFTGILVGDALWMQCWRAGLILLCLFAASKRPPSDRGKKLAAKLRGYKARLALARLQVAPR